MNQIYTNVRIAVFVALLSPQVLAFSDLSPSLWLEITPTKNASENCKKLSASLESPQNKGKIVAIAPGKVFEINCTITVGHERTLYVPAGSELVFVKPPKVDEQIKKAEFITAIAIPGQGQLLGNGTLRVQLKNPAKLPETSEVLQATMPRVGVLLSGSEGIVQFGKIDGFEFGVLLLGDDRGSAYNDVRVRKIHNSLQAIKLDAVGSGWVNQNYVHVSRIATNLAGNHPLWKTTYGVHIDSHTRNTPNANRFSGSIENVGVGIYLSGMFNRMDGLRLELDGGTKIEIQNTSFVDKNCPEIGKAPPCFPTRHNWWFGEYGVINKDRDLVFGDFFKKKTKNFAIEALTGYGVQGFGL
jgi:hypothetical protein